MARKNFIAYVRNSCLAVLFLSQFSFAVAQGQSSKRYAVVDMQAIILKIPEGQQARAKLEKEIKAKEKQLLAQKKELDKLNKDWQSQAPLLSESARFKKQQEFQQKFLALRNEEMSFQQGIKRKEQAATQKIAVSVSKVVANYAKSQGYEMVFESSSAGLIYLKNPIDITDKVISIYSSQSKAPAAAKK